MPAEPKTSFASTLLGCGCLTILALLGIPMCAGIGLIPMAGRRAEVQVAPSPTPAPVTIDVAQAPAAPEQITLQQDLPKQISPPADERPTASIVTNPSAEIIRTSLVPFRNPTTKKTMQQVKATWKNTGNVPIRVIDAKFTFRDQRKNVLQEIDYTLFAVSNSEKGVAPGETYSTPKDEGFLFINIDNPEKKASTVEIKITKILEHSPF